MPREAEFYYNIKELPTDIQNLVIKFIGIYNININLSCAEVICIESGTLEGKINNYSFYKSFLNSPHSIRVPDIDGYKVFFGLKDFFHMNEYIIDFLYGEYMTEVAILI